jgi:hypothetical protein
VSPHPYPSPVPSRPPSPGEGEKRRSGLERGDEELRRIEHELRLALSEIRYGSIEIVIQDSRVVQIERREKVRFDREGREGR